MTARWLGQWLTAFALTQVVEMGVYANAPWGPDRPRRERLAIAFGGRRLRGGRSFP